MHSGPIDPDDPEMSQPRRRMPITLGLASLAMLTGDNFGTFPVPYRPAPRPPQTDEQRDEALRAAEEKRARRRAKLAAQRQGGSDG